MSLVIFIERVEKNDKMQNLTEHLSLFHNVFDKLDKTKAQILDRIYHITLD